MNLTNQSDALNEAAKNTTWAFLKLAAYNYIESDRGRLTAREKQGKQQATTELIVNGLPIALYVTGSIIQELINPTSTVTVIGPKQPVIYYENPLEIGPFHGH